MGKHTDPNRPTDDLRLSRLIVAGTGAHRAQPTLPTAEIDRELRDWTPGEIPPLPTWHDVWAGNPDTDKAWRDER